MQASWTNARRLHGSLRRFSSVLLTVQPISRHAVKRTASWTWGNSKDLLLNPEIDRKPKCAHHDDNDQSKYGAAKVFVFQL